MLKCTESEFLAVVKKNKKTWRTFVPFMAIQYSFCKGGGWDLARDPALVMIRVQVAGRPSVSVPSLCREI